MDTRIIAERNAQAQQRLLTAAETIAGRLGLLEPLAVVQAARHRDPQLALLFQREALAGLLEAVQAALIEPVTVAAETSDLIVGDELAVDTPPVFEEPPTLTPPIVAEELHVTKPGKPAKKSGR